MQNDIYAELARLSTTGEDVALCTVIAVAGSTPREEGSKMIVRANGSIIGTIGGGAVEKAAIQEALEVLRRGRAKKMEYKLNTSGDLGMLCGGDTEIFIEPIFATSKLYIFGAGHIALPLSQMATIVGFKVTVIDERTEFASSERFPDANVMPIEIPEAYSQISVGQGDYIVIVTHGHKGDEVALESALRTSAKYIGMIGSQSKNKAVYEHLLEKNFTMDDLSRVYAPIGLHIKAQTPEEIAVAILAEIIGVRHGVKKVEIA
ncbi:MAG: XdhC/CoxI family protein [Dehalococcoidia bacterium]|nr:XdhC/CoxI family protein [Dehalococcoidia bacterium]